MDIAIIAEKTFDQLSQMDEAQRSQYLIQSAVDMNLMALGAEDLELGKAELFQRRLAFEKARLLQEALVQNIVSNAATEAKVQAAYDQYVATFVPKPQRRFSHILLKSQSDADAVLTRLAQSEEFADIGREVSIDPAGKTSLDLGFLGHGDMVGPLDEAGFDLAKTGDVSAPVSTQFGWHLLRFEEGAYSEPESLEVRREQISNALVSSAIRAELEALSERYGVQMLDQASNPEVKPE